MWNRVVQMCAAFLLLPSAVTAAQIGMPGRPTPVEPIAAILEAFRTHDIVALTTPNDNVQVQTFLLSLVRDPRLPAMVNDIVIETASARYQDVIDRFVRGEDVQRDVLRKAWDNHTMPNNIGVQTEEMIREVRAVNASLSDTAKLRLIAGDPPIDWDHIISGQDHRRWIELRDPYPADLIRRQVLDRRRRALVIYGQGHLQRRQIVSNYDMSTWESQTLISLLERDPTVRVFNVWTLLDRGGELADGVALWRVPSLARTQDTSLGAMDFGKYFRGLADGTRFAVRNGQLVPLPREAWQTMQCAWKTSSTHSSISDFHHR